MKNKKGQILLIGGIVAFISLVMFLIFFFVSTKVRWIVVGVGLLVICLLILFKNFDKINKTRGIVLAILFVVSLFFILGSSILQTQFISDRYVEIPYFASVECQESGVASSFTGLMSTKGNWISNVFPKNTQEWNVILSVTGGGLNPKIIEYYVCPSRSFCSNRVVKEFTYSGGSVNIGQVPSNYHVWTQAQKSTLFGIKEYDGGSYRVTYKPFKLIRDDPLRGGRQEISNTCVIPTSDSSWRKRITSSESSGISVWKGTNSLQPGDFYNYVTANIVAVTDGNTQDGGWCIRENNVATVYAIEQIETGDGSVYNRVNMDKSISNPECCNGEAYPGQICQNGNLIDVVDAECETRADCGIIEWSPTTGDRYSVERPLCDNGKCIFETKDTECTLDTQCKTTEYCSRNTWTCELSSDTDIGDEGEDRDVNGLGCEWWQQEGVVSEVDRPLVNKLTLGLVGKDKITVITTPVCILAQWIPWAIGGIVILILGTITILLLRKPKPKSKKRKK